MHQHSINNEDASAAPVAYIASMILCYKAYLMQLQAISRQCIRSLVDDSGGCEGSATSA